MKANKTVKFMDTHFATIYLNGDKAIKVYDDNVKSDERITERVFNKLSDIDSDAFINLHNYSTDDIFLNGYRETVVSAYSYDFIKKISSKMIDMPMDYTIETLYKFRNLVELLNMHRIAICDAHGLNVVPGENGLVIIDPDRYFLAPDAHAYNLESINYYIADLWGDEYGFFDDDPDREKIKDLFYSDDLYHYIEVMKSRLDEKYREDKAFFALE